MTNKQSKYRYIYNQQQAGEYLKQGCNLIAIGRHEKTGNKYYMFLKNNKLFKAENAWSSNKQ
ncbi:hypothetical protein [Clostridium ganghwense]|uniref:Transposase n=1 Tax=Clostridium ganghwense TaxID=312089 RepID=A0ABT4CUM4_9CLOT|nr:hypothetical protein [Clostridium ganghwense]MCY6372759.1 hypothetical protein [Clostridium ganghwense]